MPKKKYVTVADEEVNGSKRRQRFIIPLITAVFVGLAAPPEEFRLEYGRYLWEQI